MDCDDLNQTSARPYCTLSQLEAAKDWVPWACEEKSQHMGYHSIPSVLVALRFGIGTFGLTCANAVFRML